MKAKVSAGLLLYRLGPEELEIFLAHPGGPYYQNKDQGIWGLPKGEVEGPENLLATAIREFQEETGIVPQGPFLDLETIQQKGGKTVYAWAWCGDWDGILRPTSFVDLEWPPHSGKQIHFPEIDRAAFFPLAQAREKINPAQIPFLERLQESLRNTKPG